MADGSPYQGERDNALAAAARLAERHGMTLDEAATGRTQMPPPEEEIPESPSVSPTSDLSHVVHLMDYQIQIDKARIAEAIERAKERGLRVDTPKRTRAPQMRQWRAFRSRRRMNPYRHARVLIEETSFPIEEIAGITGLDVYKVTEIKLKLRPPGSTPRKFG